MEVEKENIGPRLKWVFAIRCICHPIYCYLRDQVKPCSLQYNHRFRVEGHNSVGPGYHLLYHRL